MAENTTGTPKLAMTTAQLSEYLDEIFPQLRTNGPPVHIEHVEPYKARLRMEFMESELRPGGTLSGPTMFKLADVSFYCCLLAMIGPVPLAVTTNMNINFLRKPRQSDLVAEVHILKLGKRLAVGEVFLYSDGSDEPVAHVTGTYSVPPPEQR
ncbi:MAG: PaaI family thioesterase [Hyphomicrobiaceae bacterium]|nr:PaaI family thioesterase [Hyphomicrobiaceae bacterium]